MPSFKPPSSPHASVLFHQVGSQHAGLSYASLKILICDLLLVSSTKKSSGVAMPGTTDSLAVVGGDASRPVILANSSFAS